MEPFFTNGANRPGVNRPVRKMVLERIVPGGTGFGANRPVTTPMVISVPGKQGSDHSNIPSAPMMPLIKLIAVGWQI